jgi:subtilase family serine protease
MPKFPTRAAASAVFAAFVFSAIALYGSSTNANTSSNGYTIANNTPGFVKAAKDTGPVDPTTVISITVWIDLQNQQQLDSLYKQQTTRGSANYHKWITQADFNAQFAPTAQQVNALTNYLQAKNLTVIDTAENNLYVKVQGTVGDIEKAFHVQIDNFNLNGVSYRSNTGNPNVSGLTGAHVAAITGMDDYGFQPNAAVATQPDGTAARVAITPTDVTNAANSPSGKFFEGQCFRPVQTVNFTSSTDNATYTGNRYGSEYNDQRLGHLPTCGYSPKQMQTAYNETSLFQTGLDGTGQTVVIVDAYGLDTIAQDADVFSQVYGLPRITSANFQVIKAPGLPNNPHDGGWADETALDVEWVHAMAPGAKIALVLATNRGSLDEAINLAVVHHLGNTISNSWSSIEGFGNPVQFDRVNRILQMAAVQGINVNFATGDYGDEVVRTGSIRIDFPASSPYATAIGGTSLALNPDNTIAFQTGWGNNETRIAGYLKADGTQPPLPPTHLGFIYGAGGGTSMVYAKPAFQATLPGTARMTPDISMLADPYTGAEIIETVNGQLTVGVIGGTSLATPMFSGLMAIAAQHAGHGFGQVAQLVYNLPADAISDVGASPLSGTNVYGTFDGTTQSAASLAAPLGNTTSFYSALYQGSTTRWYVLTFGTDSTLTTAPGWDNVTGVGTPNGAAFVNALSQQ